MATAFRKISVLFCALALGSALGCGDDDGGTGVPIFPDASSSCVDGDGDGYGVDCSRGDDCDDTNAAITDECQACLDIPVQQGCPCEPQMGLECVPPPIPHPEGQLVCREGTRFCRDGFWTACEPLGEYILVRD